MKSVFRYLLGILLLGLGGYEAIRTLTSSSQDSDTMSRGFIAFGMLAFGIYLLLGSGKKQQPL